MVTNRNIITVCYPSVSGITEHQEHFCAVVDGVPLPEALADLFTAEVLHEDDRIIVRVDLK